MRLDKQRQRRLACTLGAQVRAERLVRGTAQVRAARKLDTSRGEFDLHVHELLRPAVSS